MEERNMETLKKENEDEATNSNCKFNVIQLDELPEPLRVSSEFQHRIYKYSKKFMYTHSFLSCFLALTYSIIAILSTNQNTFDEWQAEVEAPGWHINGRFFANTFFSNILAVAVNLNLCFGALLVIGFYKQSRKFIWLWYIGQFFIELFVTTVLVLAIAYDCKPASLMAIPVFLYYAFALSFFRNVLASTVIRRYKISPSSSTASGPESATSSNFTE